MYLRLSYRLHHTRVFWALAEIERLQQKIYARTEQSGGEEEKNWHRRQNELEHNRNGRMRKL